MQLSLVHKQVDKDIDKTGQLLKCFYNMITGRKRIKKETIVETNQDELCEFASAERTFSFSASVRVLSLSSACIHRIFRQTDSAIRRNLRQCCTTDDPSASVPLPSQGPTHAARLRRKKRLKG